MLNNKFILTAFFLSAFILFLFTACGEKKPIQQT